MICKGIRTVYVLSYLPHFLLINSEELLFKTCVTVEFLFYPIILIITELLLSQCQ